ncbi:hypothetical protein FOMG_18898 [Fusarium oxysporum f. sp. melonis 26406]|uniref:Uncharacterized protein n=1 Tax=Fusarium oxysporum f. sp. melonis 26406 TaxID=1089452 RepID=W9ZTD2_FUSOX|nr:hypothetical protein FOMG_18898 [Fusarium oxysporum f. sp. melonis 26406]
MNEPHVAPTFDRGRTKRGAEELVPDHVDRLG